MRMATEQETRAIFDAAAALVVAWERGRLAGGNERLWGVLRDALERAGELGFYGITVEPTTTFGDVVDELAGALLSLESIDPGGTYFRGGAAVRSAYDEVLRARWKRSG